MDIFKKIEKCGVLPVVKLSDAGKSEPLAAALADGGLDCAEITFRTSCAAEVIARTVKAFPDMLVGAGTVLTAAQADEAVSAGARFIVSPGLNPDVVRHCISIGIPVIPGVATPTELEAAMALGLDTVKFFPAEAFGGIKTLKAISAPYGGARFMPTGGISLENLASYLSFPKVLACGGSFMVTPQLIDADDYAGITALARRAADIVAAYR